MPSFNHKIATNSESTASHPRRDSDASSMLSANRSFLHSLDLKLSKFDTFLFNIIKIRHYLKTDDSGKVDEYVFRVFLNLFPDDNDFLNSDQEINLKKNWLQSIITKHVPKIDELPHGKQFNIKYYSDHNTAGQAKMDCINQLINNEFYNLFIYLFILNNQDEETDTNINDKYHKDFNNLFKKNWINLSDQSLFKLFKNKLVELHEANKTLDDLKTIATARIASRAFSVSNQTQEHLDTIRKNESSTHYTKPRDISTPANSNRNNNWLGFVVILLISSISIGFGLAWLVNRYSRCNDIEKRVLDDNGKYDKSKVRSGLFGFKTTVSEVEANDYKKNCEIFKPLSKYNDISKEFIKEFKIKN